MVVATENLQQVQMLTLSCSNVNCFTKLRIGRFIRHPITRAGGFTFCPVCGEKAYTHNDNVENYWESLSKAYGLPVEAIIAIHHIWNPQEQPIFKKFVEEMKQEAGWNVKA